MPLKILLGVLLPFLGTSIGALCVYFVKKNLGSRFKCIISGFAAGVMIAASVWSLLIPAMEYESSRVLGAFAFLPATVGLWAGILFLMLTKRLTKRIDENDLFARSKRSFGENAMLFWAVTIHNLPEGMAVGVVYAAMLAYPSTEAYAGALALSIGIAIQNIPEGAIISMPIYASEKRRWKAFFIGILSGVVEPIGALLTIAAISVVLPFLPFLLGFAAGAMIYAVINELMPDLDDTHNGVISFSAGFCVMMVLDILLG